MTVKTETNFYKSFKKCLENGSEKYIITRIESYVTPGFPDCLIYHNDVGFFTLELKVVRRNKKGIGKVLISPFQMAWNTIHMIHGAPVFILAGSLDGRYVKLFSCAEMRDLRAKNIDSVPGLYEGRLADLDLCSVVRETPKLPS